MSNFSGFRCLCGATLLAAVLASAHAAPAATKADAPATPASPAGTPTSAPSGSTSPTPVPPAPVKVTPELRAAIKELLTVTHAKEGLRNAYQLVAQSLPTQMAQAFTAAIQQNPGLTDENKKQVRERLSKSFEASVKEAMAVLQDPKLIDDAIENIYPIYASYFTLDEIKQLTAFYNSPVGAKSMKVMPQVSNESMRSGMARVS
ncbi:MAG: DUF2059 domain-containing protein, partial [Verrucomicrobiota bacterium]|nr:DUF2059 domain-containing protein [Verrucomicrobiota bacterium]